MSERAYDVVLYGASGFVGKQTVQYFANHTSSEGVQWAIAGRNRQKLEAVRADSSKLQVAVDWHQLGKQLTGQRIKHIVDQCFYLFQLRMCE
jgi:short subunit dehydrogenase-like uncharacterized protein